MKISDVIIEAKVRLSKQPNTIGGKISGAVDAVGQAIKYAPYPSSSTSFAVDVTSDPADSKDEPESYVKQIVPKISGNKITVPATRTTPEQTYYRNGGTFIDEKGQEVTPELHQVLKALSKAK